MGYQQDRRILSKAPILYKCKNAHSRQQRSGKGFCYVSMEVYCTEIIFTVTYLLTYGALEYVKRS